MTASAASRPTRVALSGCGAVAELYYEPVLRALARQGRIDVVALFDPDRERRDVLGARFPRAARCADLAPVFETRPRLLVIASPPRFHTEQAVAALDAGIDVLCEKPLAPTYAQAQQMVEIESARGRLLAVGMVRRQMPAAEIMRMLLGREVLGELTGFEVFEGGPFHWPVHAASYFDARTSGGGVLLDIGAHVLDLLVWWLGAPSKIVAADDEMGGVEANARLTLECGGVAGVVRLSRDWERPNHVTICGAKGMLRWDLAEIDRVSLTLDGAAPLEVRAPAGRPATFLDCFEAQLSAVLDVLADNPAAVVRAADVLPSIEAIEAAYRDRQWMAMPWLSPAERDAALRARSSGATS